MHRSTRLLVSLGAIALSGLGALSYLARQYEKRAAASPVSAESPSSRAAHLVSGFLAVGGAVDPAPQALAAAGLTAGDYAGVRRAATAWASGDAVEDAALREALAAERCERP
jgi:hypothetical protein